MEEIDWSKAPEGATHYYPSAGAYVSHWMKIVGGVRMCCKAHCEHLGTWHVDRDRIDAGRYIGRAPSWNGQGLPPVGMVCEMHHDTWQPNNWPKVTVKYASAEYFITEDGAGEQHWHAHSVKFRPIRTPEQIAADERKSVIDDLMRLYIEGASGHIGGMAAIYEAGYRKP